MDVKRRVLVHPFNHARPAAEIDVLNALRLYERFDFVLRCLGLRQRDKPCVEEQPVAELAVPSAPASTKAGLMRTATSPLRFTFVGCFVFDIKFALRLKLVKNALAE